MISSNMSYVEIELGQKIGPSSFACLKACGMSHKVSDTLMISPYYEWGP